jgi:hypothetical protein
MELILFNILLLISIILVHKGLHKIEEGYVGVYYKFGKL